MTDKFDPNATPECDSMNFKGYASDANDMPEENFVYYADAQTIERRARLAEEKLRIAELFIIALANSPTSDAVLAQQCFEEIEWVGKL